MLDFGCVPDQALTNDTEWENQVHKGTDLTVGSNTGSKDIKSFKGLCDWRNNGPKTGHLLSPRTYESVFLHDTGEVGC